MRVRKCAWGYTRCARV